MKFSRNVDRDVDLNQNMLLACWSSKGLISNVCTTNYGVKLKLSGHVEGDFELIKRNYVHTTTPTTATSATAATTATSNTTSALSTTASATTVTASTAANLTSYCCHFLQLWKLASSKTCD